MVTQGLSRLLGDIRLRNLSDLALKVTYNGAIKLPIYDFLLVSNIIHMSISHRLADNSRSNFFFYLLSLGRSFALDITRTLTPGRFFSESNHVIPGSGESFHPKILIG